MADIHPLTAAQHGIWAGQQLDPASPAYFAGEYVELAGPLDVSRLETAIRAVMAASPALHARFLDSPAAARGGPTNTALSAVLPHAGEPATVASHGPVQVLAVQEEWPLPVLEMADEDAALAWMRSRLTTSPDLVNGPLFLHAVLRVDEERHYWYLQMHHILADGYAFALLIRAVADSYSGRPVRLGSYQAVLEEDTAYHTAYDMGADRDFWLAYLADRPAPVSLASGSAHVTTPIRVTAALPRLRDPAADPIAAVATYLDRDEVVLGLPVMGRIGSVALRVPCMAMNIVPLRLRDTSPEAVGRELETIRPHSRYRYEQLRRDLGLVGGDRRLFGPVVNVLPFDFKPRFEGLTASVHNVSAGPVEDISFAFGKELVIDANPALYTSDELHGHASAIVSLLSGKPAPRGHTMLDGGPVPTPSKVLDLIASHDPARIAVHGVIHIPRRVDEGALATQDGMSITEGDGKSGGGLRSGVTYGELVAAAWDMTGKLTEVGAGPGTIVAVKIPRSVEAIVAMLAVLQTEATYLPLDPAASPARESAILADARPVALIDEHSVTPVAGGRRTEPGIAYIIYTSGSTGTPNGVMVGHEALEHFVAGATVAYGLSADDRVLQFAPLHFDASIEEIFLTLCAGAALVLRDDEMLDSIPALLSACAKHEVTVLDLPTAYWHELAYVVGSGAALPACVRMVIIGGEAALPDRVARWRQAVDPSVRLLNTYGPTEATVVATYAHLSTLDSVSIGRPLPGVRAAVCHGELWLMGGGLSHGYLDRPDLTAQRFTTLGGERAYRTGDLVSVVNGELVYAGRVDDELKISGYRIDPAAVESVLLTHPAVREAAVIGQALPSGGHRLTAFVTTTDTAIEAAQEPTFAEHCAKSLPAPAVPSSFVVLPRLPRNSTGKIDRRALRDHAVPSSVDGPVSETERVILDIWQEVLGVPLSVSDDFFLRGGQSLQTIQVAARLSVVLGRDVPVRLLFAHPTAASLAAALNPASLTTTTLAPQPVTGVYDLAREAAPDAPTAADTKDLAHEPAAPTTGALSVASTTKTRHVPLATGALAAPAETDMPYPPSATDTRDLTREPAQPANTAPRPAFTNATPALDGPAATGARDLAREAALPAEIVPEPTYLLTGATGFVGSHLLAELLRRTTARVICLVRATSDTHARHRLVESACKHALEISLDRVTVIAADLTNLPPPLCDQLASQVDAIYHSAATVSVMRGYDTLRPANVDATIALLRIAAANRPTAFHHISTIAVGPAAGVPEDFIGVHSGLVDGYQQSKWVAEDLVRQARQRGLAAYVYRLGRVTGAAATGIVNPDDLVWRVLRAGLPHGLLPDLDVSEAWTPVDHVAKAIVDLSSHPPRAVHNISAKQTVSFADVVTWLREYGYQLETVPVTLWPSKLPDPTPETSATLAFFEGPPPGPPGPIESTHDTPAVDQDLMHRYLTDAVLKGYIPKNDGV